MPFMIPFVFAAIWLSACTKHTGAGEWWKANGDRYDVGAAKNVGIPKEGK